MKHVHWTKFPKSDWRWKNFSPAEIACRDYGGPDEGMLLVDERSMDMLQELRDLLGKPLMVNSAFRPHRYNRKIGGAASSKHLTGKAFDISMENHDPAQFEAAARQVGFKGFGFYKRNNFIHIDTRSKAGEWGKRWFNKATRYNPARNIEQAFSQETKLKPETVSEDRQLITAAIAAVPTAGGVIASLSDSAQLAAILGALALGLVGLIVVARARKWF